MQRITARDYHDLVSVAAPRLHPDGESVVFVSSTPDDDEEYESTIYYTSLGGGPTKRYTAAEGVDSMPRWSPAGDWLAFVSADRGEDDPSPQLWLLPTDGGEAERITNVVGGVESLEWSPDGTKIVFTQSVRPIEREDGHDLAMDPEYEREEPDPRVIDRLIYRGDATYLDDTHPHVYVYDRRDDSITCLTGAIDPDRDLDYRTPTWGDSQTVFYSVCRATVPDDAEEYDVDAYDLHDDTAETLFTTTGYPSLAGSTDDRVAYTYRDPDRLSMRQTEIKVYDRTQDQHHSLTAPLDRTAMAPQWDPGEDAVYFLVCDEGSQLIYRATASTEPDPHPILNGDRHVSGFDVGRDAIAFVQSEWDHPGDVFAVTPAGEEEVRLTRVNQQYLDDRPVCNPEPVRFDSDGATDLHGWLLTPPDFDPDDEYPLVVEIHGGPHVMWSTAGSMWHEWQSLAQAGYCVFWCNPRGSAGYGEDHMMAIYNDWGRVTMTDIMAGVDTISNRSYIDADNAFVTGGSFGGFMVAWLIGHTDFFRAACSQRGVYDIASFYGSTDAFKLIEGDFGTTPWEAPAQTSEHSPVAYVDQVETPTLVMHSENDYRAPINTGEMFALFLQKNGVDTRFVRYPREGHELSRSGEPAHVVDRLERIQRWFDGYSTHPSVPPAKQRAADAGLSAGEDEDT